MQQIRYGWLLLPFLLSHCQSTPTSVAEEDYSQQKIRASSENVAVLSLWQQANTMVAQQNHQEASRLLLQALAISPRHALLWSRLAEIRAQQELYLEAENAALLSLLFSDQDRLRYRNWTLIGHSREKRGDIAGARVAQTEVQRLQQR